MNDLVDSLRRTCDSAAKGDRVLTMHLFAIEHADRLRGINLRELASRAGIGESFGTELRKGVRLADYVKIVGKPSR